MSRSTSSSFFLLLALLWLPLQAANAALTENGSRIADSSRNTLAAIDADYTLTSNSQLIIYAAGVNDPTECRLRSGEGGHSPQYRVLAGSWANVPTSNGSGPYLEATGTVLSNNSSVSNAERLANLSGTGSYIAGAKEFTSSTNLEYSIQIREDHGEAQWAMNFRASPDNTTYEFRVRWGTKDCGNEYVTYSARITTASSGPHFSISHDGSATTCDAESITIVHHDGSHAVDTSYTGTITLSTSTSNGDWSLVTGSGTLNNSGSGSATYTYDGADNGSVVLGLLNTNAETLNIDVTDGTDSEDNSEDASLTFTSASAQTFRDEFNAVSYSGSDGSASWATDWLEINESNGPSSGDERVVSDQSSNRIRVRNNDGAGEGVQRELDLSTFVSATLSFVYRRDSLDVSPDYVTVDVSANGGSSWTELDRLSGPATDSGYLSASYDISAYIASNTRIRFLGSPSLGDSDQVYFDDVEISADNGTGCGGGSADHFSISHDGSGINCQAEPVTFTAHDSGHSVVSAYAGIATLSTSTSHGDWSIITGAGTLDNATADDGAATYSYDAADNGSAVLGLTDTYSETVNINVTDGSAIEDASEDANLVFASSGFNFLADATKNAIGTQIGGKVSNASPGAQTIELEAVRTSDDTGACEAALTGINSVNLAFECEDPSACTARQVAISGANIAGNPGGSVSSFTSVDLDFGDATDTTATFTLSYPDVGQLQLHARRTLSPSGETMVGASNSFVVRPFALYVTAPGNPAASTSSGSVLTSAGTNFTSTVSGVLWSSGDDGDNNGIADNHDDTDPSNNADLSDNTVALNYGQESVMESVTLIAVLDQPSGGTDPGLSGGTTIGAFSAGSGTSSTVRYDEVGIIEMSAAIADGNYLGIGAPATAAIVGKSGYVGRFNPARYAVTTSIVTAACSSIFTYARQPFAGSLTLQAQNGSAGGYSRTANYLGGFVTLDPPSELVLVNDQTAGAYDLQTIGFSQDFDTGTTGEAVLALQFRWDMPQQAPVVSTAQVTGVTDEVTVIAGAPVDIGFSSMRYGRIALTGALGSELVNLAVPMRAEYFVDANTEFVINSNDSCSSAVNVSFSDYAGNLLAGDTCVLDTGSPGDSGAGCVAAGPVAQRFDAPPIGGDFNLFLQASGVGNDGSVTVDAVVPDWLKFDWDAAAPGDENPSAPATFGIYRGGDRQIYRREMY